MNILPTKFVPEEFSLLGVGALLLMHIDSPTTPTRLWDQVRAAETVLSFRRFMAALTLLHAFGVVELVDGQLRKVRL